MVKGRQAWATLPVTCNGPDLDGDLPVDLYDIALFAGDFFGPCQFRSDLVRAGALDLLDIVQLAAAWGKSCP